MVAGSLKRRVKVTVALSSNALIKDFIILVLSWKEEYNQAASFD